MSITIYHNPRCSKSRQTLQILKDRKIEAIVVEYLKSPPSASELRNILKMLAMTPRDLVRTGEAVYRELGLEDDTIDDEALLAAMLENPILIERPIVVAGNKARIGRPPESVLEILGP